MKTSTMRRPAWATVTETDRFGTTHSRDVSHGNVAGAIENLITPAGDSSTDVVLHWRNTYPDSDPQDGGAEITLDVLDDLISALQNVKQALQEVGA